MRQSLQGSRLEEHDERDRERIRRGGNRRERTRPRPIPRRVVDSEKLRNLLSSEVRLPGSA